METIDKNKKIEKSRLNTRSTAVCEKQKKEIESGLLPGKTMEQIRMEAVARLRKIGIFI